jgi:hypothetical protein
MHSRRMNAYSICMGNATTCTCPNLCMYSLALRLGQATFWEAYINALEVPGVISATSHHISTLITIEGVQTTCNNMSKDPFNIEVQTTSGVFEPTTSASLESLDLRSVASLARSESSPPPHLLMRMQFTR